MLTKKQIIKELNEAKDEYDADAKLDIDERLPCCDYRELETKINILTWVLNT